MDFQTPSPLGASANIAAQIALRKQPDVKRVEAANDANKSRADMHNAQSKGQQAISTGRISSSENSLQTPDPLASRYDPPLNPDEPTGPPPTFRVSLLEMERSLQTRLASIEAHRANIGTQPEKQLGAAEMTQVKQDESHDIDTTDTGLSNKAETSAIRQEEPTDAAVPTTNTKTEGTKTPEPKQVPTRPAEPILAAE